MHTTEKNMLYLLYQQRLNGYEKNYFHDFSLLKRKFEVIRIEKPFITVQTPQNGSYKGFVRLWMTEPTKAALKERIYPICEVLATLAEAEEFIKENGLVEKAHEMENNKLYCLV